MELTDKMFRPAVQHVCRFLSRSHFFITHKIKLNVSNSAESDMLYVGKIERWAVLSVNETTDE